MEKRKIAVIVGSANDFKQCADGLDFLRQKQADRKVDVNVYVRSVHRHTHQLQWLLDSFAESGELDVIIAGAGKAAALPGFIDAYLRHYLRDAKIPVIGVAFNGHGILDRIAARLSITRVPGTQVIFAGHGAGGFRQACLMACNDSLPAIKLANIPPDADLSLDRAIELVGQ